jgi:thiol-disulfide isomerase/thioredoxin
MNFSIKTFATTSIFLLTFTLTSSICKSQTNFLAHPQIGKPFTDFVLDSVYNYPKRTLSENDFKNKWIILEFWGENCSGCIANLPKMHAIQQKFQKDVQFILVTKTYKDPNTAILLFKRLQNKLGLTVPASFDQNFVNAVGPDGLPTTIILNSKRVVEAITHHISEDDVNSFLSGKKPQLSHGYLLDETKPWQNYNSNIPLLINGNGGDESDYLYRSIITKWKPSMGRFDIFVRRDRLEILQGDLKCLYRVAYFGKYSWGVNDTALYGKYYYDPILQVEDTNLFKSDFNTGSNFFCYSLSFSSEIYQKEKFIPWTIADKPKFKNIMQNDLQNFFGYTVKIETRKMPCYKFVATKEALEKLRTKGGPELSFKQPLGNKGIDAKNISIRNLIAIVTSSAGFPPEMQIIDETGSNENIDIQINALYFDDWIKELHKNGLDLVPYEKDMKVLVINDPSTKLDSKYH